ncbi:unnamed protein product [Acanthoscelides obtectus]|uniref:J domain-containing protein n=1 Tax=Acanthoscelides obtectus TaxID=200917 RepID=A0A9P0KHG3_ACAOB|nr:unnamed protein product [Acanthoscelides obtectus]CAK1620601.1 J domain-containing protein CG6693 [Acanthoscelides obtectus]
MSFKSLCLKYFGSSDFYEVLGVESSASEKEIKKAYHKLSLQVHPDRVDEDQKEVATEKFKVLGKIHAILQNKEQRRVYDDAGEFDEEMDSTFNWMDYWSKLFKPIEIKDIENHEKEYIGSETERRDIKKAYVNSKGDWNKILEMVPFSNCENEPRIREIVQEMVDSGDVESFKQFFNENKAKTLRRHKKWEKEKKELENIKMEDIEREMHENMKKRAQKFSDLLSNLEEKYAPPNKKQKMAITNRESRPRRTKK